MQEATRFEERAAARNGHSQRGPMDEKVRRSGGMAGLGDDQPRPSDPPKASPTSADKSTADTRIRQILDALPLAVYTTDRAGLVTYYNRAAAELVGRQPK